MKDIRTHPGNVGAHYQYLFLKELSLLLKDHQEQLSQLIRQQIPIDDALEFQSETHQQQKETLYQLISKIKKTEWGRRALNKIREKMLQKSKQLYQFDTQRNYFLVETFRQAANPPTVKSPPQNCYNLTPLYKICVNKELRRTIWVKQLMNEHTKFQFFKYDHLVCPYNLMEELTIGLVRVGAQIGVKIKENQKDCALRILQYVIKKWDRIPLKSEQYLALGIVDLYAHYTPSKIQELGSIYVGLTELSEYYFYPDVEVRLQMIHKACSLVDEETYTLVKEHYLPYSQKKRGEGDINQCFQHFRMTCTFAYFPVIGAQFVVDQLLIKKRNRMDMYILFSIMLMIMSDDLEKYKGDKLQLSDIIKPEMTKKIIKLEDVVDAFRVIYEKIPVMHGNEEQGRRSSLDQVQPDPQQKNHLLEQMRKYDELEKMAEQAGEGQQVLIPSSNEIKIQEAQLKDFVKVGNKQPLRLGNKM